MSSLIIKKQILKLIFERQIIIKTDQKTKVNPPSRTPDFIIFDVTPTLISLKPMNPIPGVTDRKEFASSGSVLFCTEQCSSLKMSKWVGADPSVFTFTNLG